MTISIIYFVIPALFLNIAHAQRFQFRLDGAVDGTFVNYMRPSKLDNGFRSPWRHVKSVFLDRIGLTSTITVDYDQLSETVSLSNALSHLIGVDDSYDYGLTAHMFTSSSTSGTPDPSNLDVHVLLHAATELSAQLPVNATELCIAVAFRSDTLQSNSVCSLSWPYDTVCIVGRTLDRRWFVGNKSVNVTYTLQPLTSSTPCSVNYPDSVDTTRNWHFIGRIPAPSIASSSISRTLENHHAVELSSSEVGRGRPQISLFLPPRDAYFRAGDLLRLPVHLNPGNSLASLLIRVNASPSLQLSEMRLLHPDWRLSIISDSNNRVAVIRATADPASNSSAVVGGPLLEYDFRVVTQPGNKGDVSMPTTDRKSTTNVGDSRQRRDQRHRSWASLDSFVDDVVVGTGSTRAGLNPSPALTPTSTAGLTWEVEMVSRDSAAVGLAAVDAVFRLDNDPMINIIPVVKVARVLNYAVLRDSIQRIPLWLYGFTAQSGIIQLWDGECSSSDPEVLKVESMCRYIYLDGSETRGSDNVTITVTRRRLTASVRISVLFPELPLKLDVSDTNLQLIRNFLVPVPASKTIHQQGGKCRSHYQRANIRVFARFSYHAFGSSFAVEADVTDWLRSIVRVVNTSVADYDGHSLVGVAPGQTLVQLITAAGQLIASRPVTVTASHPVSITRLDALIADRIDVSILPSQTMAYSRSPSSSVADNSPDKFSRIPFFDITATLRRVSPQNQRGSTSSSSDQLSTQPPSRLFVVAHFSDGTFLDLATLPSNWYELSIQPAANADVAVPRVALFEVAKCRRQSVDEQVLAQTTAIPTQTDASPLSVIHIDGLDLFPTNEIDSSSGSQHRDPNEISRNSSHLRNSNNETTTIVLGVVLGILLIFLLILVFIAFRRRISSFLRKYFGEDHPIFIYFSICHDWLMSSNIKRYLVEYVIEKPKLHFGFQRRNFELPKRASTTVSVAVNDVKRDVSNFDEIQSCGEEVCEEVYEPASRTDKNWVWLSRETLEKNSIETTRSHPLLPEATFRSLCCSVGSGIGTGARSPAVSTTGSNASRSGRSSAAALIRPLIAEEVTCSSTTTTRTAAATSNEEFEDASPISFAERNYNHNGPTIYKGSECSLRIFPGQPSRHGSTAALQLVAPDGKLMATAFASRTLDHHRRRIRGYPNLMGGVTHVHGGGVDDVKLHGANSLNGVHHQPVDESLTFGSLQQQAASHRLGRVLNCDSNLGDRKLNRDSLASSSSPPPIKIGPSNGAFIA